MNQQNLFEFKYKKVRKKKVATKRQYKPKFYGKIVPLPIDKNGQPYVCWPFFIYLRTDGKFVVTDKRRPLGDQTIHVCSNIKQALRKFVKEKRNV